MSCQNKLSSDDFDRKLKIKQKLQGISVNSNESTNAVSNVKQISKNEYDLSRFNNIESMFDFVARNVNDDFGDNLTQKQIYNFERHPEDTDLDVDSINVQTVLINSYLENLQREVDKLSEIATQVNSNSTIPNATQIPTTYNAFPLMNSVL